MVNTVNNFNYSQAIESGRQRRREISIKNEIKICQKMTHPNLLKIHWAEREGNK